MSESKKSMNFKKKQILHRQVVVEVNKHLWKNAVDRMYPDPLPKEKQVDFLELNPKSPNEA